MEDKITRTGFEVMKEGNSYIILNDIVYTEDGVQLTLPMSYEMDDSKHLIEAHKDKLSRFFSDMSFEDFEVDEKAVEVIDKLDHPMIDSPYLLWELYKAVKDNYSSATTYADGL